MSVACGNSMNLFLHFEELIQHNNVLIFIYYTQKHHIFIVQMSKHTKKVLFYSFTQPIQDYTTQLSTEPISDMKYTLYLKTEQVILWKYKYIKVNGILKWSLLLGLHYHIGSAMNIRAISSTCVSTYNYIKISSFEIQHCRLYLPLKQLNFCWMKKQNGRQILSSLQTLKFVLYIRLMVLFRISYDATHNIYCRETWAGMVRENITKKSGNQSYRFVQMATGIAVPKASERNIFSRVCNDIIRTSYLYMENAVSLKLGLRFPQFFIFKLKSGSYTILNIQK